MQAADTGRVLMLQRALDDGDPAGGRWEFPGGHLEDGEPSHLAACREWCEEVGQLLPPGTFGPSWQAGRYEGHVWRIDAETDVDLSRRDAVINPDDPDGDAFEAVAWFDPTLLQGNPALRDELAADLPVVLSALGVEPLAKATWDDHPARRVEDKLADYHAAKINAALRKLVTPEAIRAAVQRYAEKHPLVKEGWNPQTQPRDANGRFVSGGSSAKDKGSSKSGGKAGGVFSADAAIAAAEAAAGNSGSESPFTPSDKLALVQAGWTTTKFGDGSTAWVSPDGKTTIGESSNASDLHNAATEYAASLHGAAAGALADAQLASLHAVGANSGSAIDATVGHLTASHLSTTSIGNWVGPGGELNLGAQGINGGWHVNAEGNLFSPLGNTYDVHTGALIETNHLGNGAGLDIHGEYHTINADHGIAIGLHGALSADEINTLSAQGFSHEPGSTTFLGHGGSLSLDNPDQASQLLHYASKGGEVAHDGAGGAVTVAQSNALQAAGWKFKSGSNGGEWESPTGDVFAMNSTLDVNNVQNWGNYYGSQQAAAAAAATAAPPPPILDQPTNYGAPDTASGYNQSDAAVLEGEAGRQVATGVDQTPADVAAAAAGQPALGIELAHANIPNWHDATEAEYTPLNSAAQQAYDGLSVRAREAMDNWTGPNSRAIQTAAVSPTRLNSFNKAMQAMPQAGDVALYRGVKPYGTPDNVFQTAYPGEVFSLNEPVSTSTSRGTAEDFGRDVYVIHSPHAAYVGDASEHPSEHEAVIAPGTFRVQAVTNQGGQRVVYLQDVTGDGTRSFKPIASPNIDFTPVTKAMPFGRVDRFIETPGEPGRFHKVPVHPGRADQVPGEVAKEGWNPQVQPRDANGRFVGGGDKAKPGSGSSHSYPEITAADVEAGGIGRSRAVSAEQFQQLAAEGHATLSSLDTVHPTTGLDQNWDSIKSSSYAAAQQPWGGATFDAHTGQEITGAHGAAYAMTVRGPGQSSVKISEHASEAEFHAAMDSARSQFGTELAKGQRCLGVFHNDAEHTIEIDPVLVVHDLHSVETIGAYTHAVGGAYNFADGQGYWPPHVGG